MILAENWRLCLYLIIWFVGLLLTITLKGLLAEWKCLWSMFGICDFLNVMRKSRNFHVFTQAYLVHAQTNIPAALKHRSGEPAITQLASWNVLTQRWVELNVLTTEYSVVHNNHDNDW